jgi:putative addiction module killer protein
VKEIQETETYKKWFSKLTDSQAKYRILVQVKRLASRNPGKGRFLGEISEMKIDYGPGYLVYYKDTGKEIIILLCGGDKSTQDADITIAKEMAREAGNA